MPPTPKTCPVSDCEYVTPASLPNYDLVYKDISIHLQYAHSTLGSGRGSQEASKPKADKLPRPEIGEGATEADWVYFMDKWNRYKRSSALEGQNAVDQLWACCTSELSRAVYDSGVSSTETETNMLQSIKKMAVRAQNTLINVVNFLEMTQSHEEAVGSFAARLKGQAAVCNFTIECSSSSCNTTTTYAEKMIVHQLTRGLADPSIQEEILAQAAQTPDMDLSTTQKLVEAKETGKRSGNLIAGGGGINRLSDRPGGRGRIRSTSEPPDDSKCAWCNQTGHGRRASKEVRQSKCRAFGATCKQCNKKDHFKVVCRSKSDKTPAMNSITNKVNQMEDVGTFCALVNSRRRGKIIQALPHHTFDEFKGWLARKPEAHPAITTSISLCTDAYRDLGLPTPAVTKQESKQCSLPDTGAMMTVAGPALIHSLGIKKKELIPLASGVSTADNAGLGMLGGVMINISGRAEDGSSRTSKQLCYIAENIHCLFLSKQACRDLGIIGDNFPKIGTFPTQASQDSHQISNLSGTAAAARPCQCPDRSLPPAPPSNPPLPAVEENTDKLKDWILTQYASSAFNQCSHQPLPLMQSSPPLELHINPKIKPVATHKPRPIPLHWMTNVKQQLDEDVRLGVIEAVPVGEPTIWCSPMVVCPKKDGSPRRTVDLQALNKATARQTHATDSPFNQVIGVPHNTFRTVLDCWNGYHSVPLKESDRHYTTFITPFGRYRYKVACQGSKAAGDGYTSRYDRIVADFKDMKKCVDDTILWGDTLEETFNKTCAYLTLCSKNGIIFNKKKFQFGRKNVEFLGFELTADSVRPSATYLQAIRDFPRPTDISGIRSWFGLINQVAYAFSMTEVMLPFRQLLKPSSSFLWTEDLQEAFTKSKEIIIEAVKEGIRTFDKSRVTCLATDWSCEGIGFFLLQKYCSCTDLTPVCCATGWKLVFAGSRFTSGAESRYAPVEGEMLGVAWALDKARHFVLGCPTLIIAVDHKPLIRLLGDKSLEDIPNPRLLNLKEKTLRYSFSMVHIPGKLNKAADATSRSPTSTEDQLRLASLTCQEDWRMSKHILTNMRTQPSSEEVEESLDIELKVIGESMGQLAELSHNTIPTYYRQTGTGMVMEAMAVPDMNILQATIQAVTWDRLQESSAKDTQLAQLVNLIQRGMPENKEDWPQDISEFHRHRDQLSVTGPAVLYRGRVVVPRSLRGEVLETLHAAHQGTTGMNLRAGAAVFWSGMTDDIVRRRLSCITCDKSAPSQPAAPPAPLPMPQYPFELICSDFFSLYGKSYLIMVDRYSGWPSIYTGVKGAAGLVSSLKTHFTTFGIAAEISTDGGTEYTSGTTQTFLKEWGTRYRQSSAHFPHSNTRAEVGVKSMKRLLKDNISPNGDLENTKFHRALLTYRNTPDRDTMLSPAQVVFGRNIRDFMPVLPQQYKPRSEWLLTMEQREVALARRHAKQGDLLSEHTKQLSPLKVSDIVMIQNQRGHTAKKWDKSGTVVEVMGHDQYRIKVDGTGRTTLRNRRFLRPFTPFTHRQGNRVHLPIQVQQSSQPSLQGEQPMLQLNTDVTNDDVLVQQVPDSETEDQHNNLVQEQHNIEQEQAGEAATREPSQDDVHVPTGSGDVVNQLPVQDGVRRSSRPRQPNRMLADYDLSTMHLVNYINH